ncbi:2'-5'-oligoadenylate synthase 1-like [Dreissena polymorpha]|uniref:2'-5'-oligoadenylate synthetase 1 domain-containing protein n=1 Tax=Dreissena polymorpha TaxID=45954 RepID=A0A9D4IGP6_DREPO|nr:2'-5'-oligoadenylate synthase 1-like [Dreissena polymorpha]KAH3771832.1 hypothetical protein DPMN_173161 [Dreissena polymorpha]
MDIYSISDERTLNEFIDNTVKPDRETLQRNNAMVDRLVHFLQNNVPGRIRPKRVIKGGSFGKGTAVRGTSDIDLVHMLAEYNSVDKYTKDSEDLLKDLKTYLTKYGQAQLVRITTYSVEVKLTNGNFSQTVDVVLGVDLLDRGMVPDHVFDQMQGPDVDVHLYSVTLTPLQIEVIQALPTQVKDLIRIVKYWGDVKKGVYVEHWPNSFTMELVVIHAWNNAGSPSTSFSMIRALHAVLTSLVNHRQFNVTFPSQMKYSPTRLKICLPQRNAPYIIDPTNPYNDMYHGRKGGLAYDWNDVATEASTWLRLSLFRSVTGTHSRWQ